ncbi:hypothetical protein HNQ51_001559 [Inhella inkyongensis]|uniref:Uncharacterized protein n=1 Tax=Inhella inkyongensis TaxID=392593 RepID=A0A840S1S5_9BURK|nr:hypothetical protein [Inhella inkyongensis]MBB5204245.1 hypothetical protein [Inhella inkyongensis]
MSTIKFIALTAAALALALTAPKAESSELVKLAKLIVTGKRTPTQLEPVKPAAAVQPAPTKADAPAVAERPLPAAHGEALEFNEPVIVPRQDVQPQRGERVGSAPPRPTMG